ncbi:MAG TPA: isoprenylcysteine carboxylmethyltransferase family protein [Acidobacteriaceae bacterium]|nr:isoprenylcysteine carboxylmethyltransferase family protein [Acidobacteriaceae bacterium]
MNQADVVHYLQDLTRILWIALVAIWLIGALKTKRTVQKQSFGSRLLLVGIIAPGVYLMAGKPIRPASLELWSFPVTEGVALLGFAAVLCGITFSVWARVTIGRNWSGVVTLKEDHTLVQRGPYRIVRHPIYSGILLALMGTALMRGEVRALLGAMICGLGLWVKATMEERFMVQRFGEEYLLYRRQVKALAPFLF